MERVRPLMTVQDVQGVWAIMPTPAKADASRPDAVDTVDLEETARAVEALIEGGVDGILTLGTFGEGASLTWDEKYAFMKTVAQTNRGRVPCFGGSTSLNTRESIRQTRAARELGLDGVMLGLPMWCKMDLTSAVQFYRDVAAACPDMAICVYANVEAFKFDFGRAFWAQVSSIPQVVSAKYLNISQLFTDLTLTQGRIRFLTTDGDHYAAARIDPEQCTAFWSSGASCGPSVAVHLRDAVRAARSSGDWTQARALAGAVKASTASLFPRGDISEFAKYNVGLEKIRIDAAGWMKAGPIRPPYHCVPEDYAAGARASGQAWAELARQYE